MKILVTGALGRIGKQLVEELLQAGYEVRGFDVLEFAGEKTNYEFVVGRLENSANVSKIVEEIDVVFHLGAFMSWDSKDKPAIFAANVDGTRLLLDAAASSGVKRFIFASSGEVYPENDPVFQPITEDHPLRPNSFYGLSKLLGEKLVGFYQRTSKMETVILRFAHTQNATELLDEKSFFSGPRFFLRPRISQQERMGNDKIVEMLRSYDPGQPAHILSRNENGRPFQMHITDTRDMVAGLMLTLKQPEINGSIFNLGATNPIDFGKLLEKMSKITDYPVIPINFEGTGVYYHTSNDLICEKLGFKPQWTIEKMLEEAKETWLARTS